MVALATKRDAWIRLAAASIFPGRVEDLPVEGFEVALALFNVEYIGACGTPIVPGGCRRRPSRGAISFDT
jgi:hypothetical protein